MATKNTKESSNTLMRVFYTLVILLFIVVGYLAYLVLHTDDSADNTQNVISSLFDKEEKEELIALGEFTLKLKDGHYATLSINTGFIGKAEELTEYIPILRDKIIFELMKLDSSHMNVEQIDGTKKLLIKELNALLPKTEIKNIYMDNLVVQ